MNGIGAIHSQAGLDMMQKAIQSQQSIFQQFVHNMDRTNQAIDTAAGQSQPKAGPPGTGRLINILG